MAAHGRPALRDLFDESPTPHIAHPHGPTIVISTSQPTGPSETPVAGWVPLSKRATARASHASRPRIRRRTTTSPSIGRCISDLTSSLQERRETPPSASSSITTRSPATPTTPSLRLAIPTGNRPVRSPSRPRRSITGAASGPDSTGSTRSGPPVSTATRTRPPPRERAGAILSRQPGARPLCPPRNAGGNRHRVPAAVPSRPQRRQWWQRRRSRLGLIAGRRP